MERRARTGNIILLISAVILLMANWNTFTLYETMKSMNAKIMAFVLIIVFLCVCDLKEVIKDKLFYLMIAINVISIVNLLVLGTGKYAIFPIFDFTMTLYLVDKIKLKKSEILISAALFAVFFIYWTIDVKGYFKGYSINYGGLVLIGGFIFLIFLEEYVKYFVSKYNGTNAVVLFIQKYLYIITIIEMLTFALGYKIMSWYRSRTAFFALVFFAVFLLIPRRFYGKKAIYHVITALIIAGGFLLPAIYVYIGRRVNPVDYQMFYKTIFDSRFTIWPDLLNIYKNFALTGVGTIYTANDAYRPGLLDTCNAFIDLLVVYGPFVCAGTLAMLYIRLVQFRKSVNDNHFAKLGYALTMTMLVASYGESMIIEVPFMLLFMYAFMYMNNPLVEDEYNALDLKKYKEMFAKGFKDKLIATTLAVLLPVILFFILGPVEIYYSNYDEFSFTNTDYLWMFISIAVLVTAVLVTILTVVPDIVNKVIIVILTAVSVASYVQYMFLNKELIMEDGEFIEAVDLGTYPLVTLAIYIAVAIVVIILACIFRKKIYECVTYAAGFITIIVLIATLSLFVTHIGKTKENMWYSGVDQFKVAKGDNVIVIVPDTFGRWALNGMLEEYPGSIDFLNDFTFFDKEDSMYYPTYPALHHMLTAYPYDGTMKRYEYTSKAFGSEKTKEFYKTLHDKDYTVRFYTPDIFFEDLTAGMVDNIEEAHITIDRQALWKLLYKMSVYRYVPYVLKAPFQATTLDIDNINVYNGVGPHWLNSDFYPAMHEQKVTIDETINNAFILHHFRGAHMPYMSNANNELVPDNSVDGTETAYGTMVLIKEYLDYLKEIDKYDDSTIIIVGDHGFNTVDSIYFIKHKNEKHDEMVVDSSPLTHAQFQDTVLEIIGAK